MEFTLCLKMPCSASRQALACCAPPPSLLSLPLTSFPPSSTMKKGVRPVRHGEGESVSEGVAVVAVADPALVDVLHGEGGRELERAAIGGSAQRCRGVGAARPWMWWTSACHGGNKRRRNSVSRGRRERGWSTGGQG